MKCWYSSYIYTGHSCAFVKVLFVCERSWVQIWIDNKIYLDDRSFHFSHFYYSENDGHQSILKMAQNYNNDTKFSGRYAWANSADPDQTALRGQSDQGLHCFPFRLHRLDSLLYGRAM